MTTITELTDDRPTTVEPVRTEARFAAWNDEDHGLWGIVRDPEAVFMPLVLGAMAVGMAVLDDFAWFGRLGSTWSPQFDDVHRVIAEQEGPRQLVPQLYFGGGALVLGVLAVLGVLVAMASRTAGVAARRITMGVATLGLAATVAAAQLDRSASLGTWLDRVDVGFWMAASGFGLVLLAAVIVRPARPGRPRQ